jgi:alkylated DNA repair dioxygenase AlkB
MQHYKLKHCNIHCYTTEREIADTYLNKCLQLPTTNVMGRRKIAQFGSNYTYSGVLHKGQPIPEWMQYLLQEVNKLVGIEFNSVLMNIYPKGVNTGIGFHRDDEPELKSDVVASLSLGFEDVFIIKNNQEKLALVLEHGDLLVMGTGCQQNYVHGITYKVMPETRISLTFRKF